MITKKYAVLTNMHVLELRERLQDTLRLGNRELGRLQSRYKRLFDRKSKKRVLKPNDLELLLRPTDRNKLVMQ